MPSDLLKGLRLLDLTDEKGALCGKMFADLGAEVIKVEPPTGCSTRRIPPYLEDKADPEHCLYSIAYHAGKKSVTANFATDDGRALVADLAAHSDFLVESHPLGYLESIGLGYDTLARKNPRLIYASITPFGDTGPGKDYNWADIITWAAGGSTLITSAPRSANILPHSAPFSSVKSSSRNPLSNSDGIGDEPRETRAHA